MAYWTQDLIATAQADGMFVRLNSTAFHTSEVSGCEATHQLGLWTSDSLRPKGRMRYGKETEFATMRRLNYVPAGVPWEARIEHHTRPKPALYCDFHPDLFQSISGIKADDTPRFLEASLAVDGPKLRQAFSRMFDEVRNPGFAHEIAVESLGHLILVEMGRHFRTIGEIGQRSVGELSAWQMKRLKAYVDDAEGSVTVGNLAELCGISSSHLRRLFKATTGGTITSYVEERRMARAQIMLRDGKLPLKDIAFRLGFANGASFSTAFRRAIGVSPLAFRQQPPS